MEKKKRSRAQEGLLIVFVTACFLLVAATLIIAFDEAGVSADTQGFLDSGNSYTTLSPSLIVPTARPHSGGGGSNTHDEHDDQIDSDRQATLAARSDAEQQGLDY